MPDRPTRGWRARLRAAQRILRRLAGMPDYEAYLAHCRAHHPDQPPADRRTFYREYLAARYGDGPTRCC